MGDAGEVETHPSTTSMRIETVRLRHVLSVPPMLLLVDAPFVSPWFSCDKLSCDDLIFRVGLDAKWSSMQNAQRNMWVHVTTNSNKRSCKKHREENKNTQETEFIISSMNICLKKDNQSGTTLFESKWSESSTFLTINTYYVMSSKLSKSILTNNANDETLLLSLSVDLLRPVLDDGDEESFSVTAAAPSGKPMPHCERVLHKLFEDGLQSDVTFKVGEEELKAHRMVLAANSPVFEAMFTSDFEEKRKGEVSVEGVRPEVMRAALQCMYLGRLEEKLGSQMYMDLLQVADRYQLSHMKKICEDRLMSEPSLDLLQILLFADMNNSPRLKGNILRRILNHPTRQKLMNEEALMTIMKTRPELMSELMKSMAG